MGRDVGHAVGAAVNLLSKFHRIIAGVQRHLGGFVRAAPGYLPLPTLAHPPEIKFESAYRLPACSRTVDQGSWGSCTGNAAAENEDTLAVLQGKPDPESSRMAPYNLARIIDGTPLTEDSGALVSNVSTALQRTGNCPEALFPYDAKSFATDPRDIPACAAAMNVQREIFGYHLRTVTAIKAALKMGAAARFGFQCPTSLLDDATAESGLILPPDASGFDGGHSMAIRGWDDEKDFGVKYAGHEVVGGFLLMQSWGPGWGCGAYGRSQGFAWIPYLYFQRGWAMDAVADAAFELPATMEKV